MKFFVKYLPVKIFHFIVVTAGIKDTEVLYVPITCCVFDEVLQGYINQRQCQSWKLGPPGNYKASLKNNALYYDVSLLQVRCALPVLIVTLVSLIDVWWP